MHLMTIFCEWLLNRVQKLIASCSKKLVLYLKWIISVFTRLNAVKVAFIKFLAFSMRRLFKGRVYLREAFISKSHFLNTDNNYGKKSFVDVM